MQNWASIVSSIVIDCCESLPEVVDDTRNVANHLCPTTFVLPPLSYPLMRGCLAFVLYDTMFRVGVQSLELVIYLPAASESRVLVFLGVVSMYFVLECNEFEFELFPTNSVVVSSLAFVVRVHCHVFSFSVLSSYLGN